MKYKLLAIVAFLLVLTTNVLADDEYHAMVDGKKVTLQNVGSGGTIVIGVSDGTGVDVLETIPASTTETVLGLEITNVETFYEDLKSGRSALIRIEGQTETKEVKLKVIVTSSYAEARNKYFLKVDDSITVNGKIVKLLNVGSGGSIVISVNEIIEEIPATATETVNGIEITNIEINYEDTKAERSAVIGVEGEVIPRAISEAKETAGKAPSWKFSVSCEKEGNLDLAIYPKPFLVNGEINKLKIVVGDKAPASDTIAAIDIATKLQYYAERQGAPIKVDINPVLASEITNRKNYNLILVGQPSNNPLILEHTAESPAGVGNIRLGQNGDNVALIVTGTTDLEVRYAAKVLANYEEYKLYGDKCEITNLGEVTYVPKKPEVKEPEKPEYGCIKNRICEPEYGENVANCPSDCKEISTPLQCNGCMSDGNCLDFGMRIVEGNIPKYCDLNKQFIPQKSANAACQNNFECDSNVCAASKCISEGFLKKIMNWFAKMFGYVVKG